jgi:ketosteroid isomerase-like protein
MHSTKRGALIVWSVALLCGLGGSPFAAAAGEGDATGRGALEAASEALDRALGTDDVEALFALVADDVVLMPPGEAPVRGKAAMREWYLGLLSQYRTESLILTDREVSVAAGLAVVAGTHEWRLQAAAGGDPVVDHGKYMQVWKQQPDGRWLFAREIWNSSVPPSGP